MGVLPLELPDSVRGVSPAALDQMLCHANPAAWAERRRGFENAPFHEEWYDLMVTESRVCCVAPREHAKTEVWTINGTAWASIEYPGTWTYVFSNTKDQAEGFLERIVAAVEQVSPELLVRAPVRTRSQMVFSNGSRVTVAGAGKAVRSAHPDLIIGDDVLKEETTRSDYQRRKMANWWFGTVSNMAHPGTVRTLRGGRQVVMPPTKVFLVGTPFHGSDLLLGMAKNKMYRYRRYAAEFHPSDRVTVNGKLTWAIEAG